MRKILSFTLAILVLTAAAALPLSAADEFPLRAKYPKSVTISTDDLAKAYGKAIIVDSRNKAEYDVIRIKGASNILVGKMTSEELTALREPKGTTPIVFYCNGVTCSKSYKASTQAVEWGFENVFCYDEGIFAWAKANPDKSEFFGKVMTAGELETALFAEDKFLAALISPADFMKKAESGTYTVFDIRDPNERSEVKFDVPKTRSMSFDTMVELVDGKKPAVPRSAILIADNVGKQVRWLQYYFEREGITDYHFLKGGVKGWKEAGFGK